MRHSCLISSLAARLRLGLSAKPGRGLEVRPSWVGPAILLMAALLAAGSARAVDPPPVLPAIAGDGSVVLLWQLSKDPSYSASLDGITSYVVFRTTMTGDWTACATLYNDFAWNSYVNTRSYWDEGLTNGVEYSYVVRAVSRTTGNPYADSATIWVTPQAGFQYSNGPVSVQSGDQWIRLNWDLGTTWWTAEPGVTQYRVFRATDPGLLGRNSVPASLHEEIPVDASYIDLAGLINKVSYYYMVFPVYPDRTPFIVKAVPFRPISSSGQPVARMDGSAPRRIRITWSPAPAPDLTQSDVLTGYAVFRSDDGGGTMKQIFWTNSSTLSVLDDVPAYGKRYVYLIRPVDIVGRLGDAYPLAIIDVELPSNRLYLNHNRFRPRLGETLSTTFQITEAGRVRVSVISLTGEKIKTLYDRDHAGKFSADAPFNSLYAGLPPLVWNGSNESGRLVGSGAYLVVLEIGKNRYIGSVAVIR